MNRIISFSERIRLWSVAIVAGMLFLNDPSSVRAYDDELGFRTAADYLNRGMYLESMGMYQEIAEYSTDTENRARALLYIATTFSMYLNQPETALERFEYILAHYPDASAAGDALFNSGMVHYEQGDFAESREAFSAYIRRHPRGARLLSAQVWAESAEAMMKETPPPSEPPAPDIPDGRLVIRDTEIRVLLMENTREIVLQAETPIRISDRFTKKEVAAPATLVAITTDGDGLNINGRRIASRECRFSADGHPLRYNNQRYRGDMVLGHRNGRLELVNRVPLEQYLYGVVPREMSPSWSAQALMAQAVAARTYALYIKSKSEDKTYDVMATTASQVYGGLDAEHPASNRAVDETRGQVMTHGNRLIIAYFHANSGGYTEDPGNVWTAGVPYLKSIRDEYSLDTPGSRWEYFLSYREARDRLGKSGMKVESLRGLKPGAKTSSGRWARMYVITADGEQELSSNNFRIRMGPASLKSTLFEMQSGDGGVLLKGRGYGHGVGMSQWGARRMARNKATYREILKHYYHDIEIVTITS